MKSLLLFFSLIIVVGNLVNAQENKPFETQENKRLDTLAQLKVQYDKAVYLERKKGINLNSEHALDEYLVYVQNIKKDPVRSELLDYIDRIFRMESNYAKQTFQYYSYIDKTMPFDRSKIISNYDFYKIVKHYLFEKGTDRLPELKDVSIIEVKQWKIPARSDIRGVSNSR